MLDTVFVSLALVAAASAVAGPAPAPANPTPHMMGMPIEFDLFKRQQGYQPTATACSIGDTCEEACGPGYITCPDTNNPDPEFSMYCYDPSIGDTCCSDLTGNSCTEGYYCTRDTSGNDWCCPNGSSLAECQAEYSISGSLISIAPLSTSASGSGSGGSSTSSVSTTTPPQSSTTASSSTTSSPKTTSHANATSTTSSASTSKSSSSTATVTAAAATQALAAPLAALAAGVMGLAFAI